MELPGPALTFIVRVTVPDGRQVAGTVERVRTGERHRFQGVEELGAIVTRIAAGEARRGSATEERLRVKRSERKDRS